MLQNIILLISFNSLADATGHFSMNSHVMTRHTPSENKILSKPFCHAAFTAKPDDAPNLISHLNVGVHLLFQTCAVELSQFPNRSRS